MNAKRLSITDLAGVVYSAGKVFDGLSAGRLETERFLRSGSIEGVASRADLALLQDLRDAGEFVLEHADRPVDAEYVRSVNRKLSRSAALRPGEFRRAEQRIGVSTPYGRHEPPPVDERGLQDALSVGISA